MKTFQQFYEDVDKRRQYEIERIRRRNQTPEEKRQDPILNKLTRLLNRENK